MTDCIKVFIKASLVKNNNWDYLNAQQFGFYKMPDGLKLK